MGSPLIGSIPLLTVLSPVRSGRIGLVGLTETVGLEDMRATKSGGSLRGSGGGVGVRGLYT